MEKELLNQPNENFSVSFDPNTSGLVRVLAICRYDSQICAWEFSIIFNKVENGDVVIYPTINFSGDDFGAKIELKKDTDNVYFSFSGPGYCVFDILDRVNLKVK